MVQLDLLPLQVVLELLQFLQLVGRVGLHGPALEQQSADALPLSYPKIIAHLHFLGPVWYKQKSLFWDVRVVGYNIELRVHLKNDESIILSYFLCPTEYNRH